MASEASADAGTFLLYQFGLVVCPAMGCDKGIG
jgi:hypothetical protein